VGQAETLQAGFGQHDRIVMSLGQLSQPRVHVASDVADLQVGTGIQQLGAAANATGADAGTGRQRREAVPVAANQDIAGTLPLGHGGQTQTGDAVGGQVLEAMHRQVDGSIQQSVLQLFGKHTLTADRPQRSRGDVALGRNVNQLDLDAELGQFRRHPFGLPAC